MPLLAADPILLKIEVFCKIRLQIAFAQLLAFDHHNDVFYNCRETIALYME
jgi:hypothetical protein